MKKIIKNFIRKLRGKINIKELEKRGLKVGKNLIVNDNCFIDPSHCWLITIGDDVILGDGVKIYSHDGSTRNLNYTKIACTTIGNRVYVSPNVVIMPGVTIGNDVIIGIGSIVFDDIPDNSVAMGNPAKVLCSLDMYNLIEQSKMNDENCFDESFTLRNKYITQEQKDNMIDVCKKHGRAFVR
ncbi:MAG TPA: acyltransferase [Bacteroidales bacterium]|nr:acyltransferase [Bacteroidales bacterium]